MSDSGSKEKAPRTSTLGNGKAGATEVIQCKDESKNENKKKGGESLESRQSRGAMGTDVWKGYGGYMAAKNRKLAEQFKEDDEVDDGVSPTNRQTSAIFNGVSIYVNGYTEPPNQELKKLINRHGGRYEHYYGKSIVSHIIANVLPTAKIRQLKGEIIVRPDWIVDSIKAGRQLPIQSYQLYATAPGQRKLNFGQPRENPPPVNQITDTFRGVVQTRGSFLEKGGGEKEKDVRSLDGSDRSGEEEASRDADRDAVGVNSVVEAGKEGMQSTTNEETGLADFDPIDEGGLGDEWDEVEDGPPRVKRRRLNGEETGFEQANFNVNHEKTPLTETGDTTSTTVQTMVPPQANLRQSVAGREDTAVSITPKNLSGKDIGGRNTDGRSENEGMEGGKKEKTNETTPKKRTTAEGFEGIFPGMGGSSGKKKGLKEVVGDDPQADAYTNSMVTRSNPDFIDQYYRFSRLSHLSRWGAAARSSTSKIVHAQAQARPPRSGTPPNTRVIMHVDMDSFFVSASLLRHPDLVDKPVAVCHSKGTNAGTNSTSELASCNYKAREFGVRNGMYLGSAKKLCPDLVTVPYYFDDYQRLSQAMYSSILTFTSEVQGVSVDEVLLDASHLVAGEVEAVQLAEEIRQNIFVATQCKASIGIGPNIMLARLSTKRAKPDGVYFMKQDEIEGVMANLKVADLPGVGWSLTSRLQEMDVTVCSELQALPLSQLQKVFGEKTGQTLYNFARGIDDRALKTTQERKSLSAEINWGVRFTNTDEVLKFISDLSNEVHQRLQQEGVVGETVTLKVKERKTEETGSYKHLGCGPCHNHSLSHRLPKPTDDAAVISKACVRLFQQLKVAPLLVRGMGIQMSRLVSKQAQATVPEGATLFGFLQKTSAPTNTENPPDPTIAPKDKNSAQNDDRLVIPTHLSDARAPKITEKPTEKHKEKPAKSGNVQSGKTVTRVVTQGFRGNLMGAGRSDPDLARALEESERMERERQRITEIEHANIPENEVSGADEADDVRDRLRKAGVEIDVFLELPRDIQEMVLREHGIDPKKFHVSRGVSGEENDDRNAKNGGGGELSAERGGREEGRGRRVGGETSENDESEREGGVGVEPAPPKRDKGKERVFEGEEEGEEEGACEGVGRMGGSRDGGVVAPAESDELADWLPTASQIDPQVLSELPNDMQAAIRAAMQRRNLDKGGPSSRHNPGEGGSNSTIHEIEDPAGDWDGQLPPPSQWDSSYRRAIPPALLKEMEAEARRQKQPHDHRPIKTVESRDRDVGDGNGMSRERMKEFLAALPPDMRQEALSDYIRQRQKQQQQGGPAPPNQPGARKRPPHLKMEKPSLDGATEKSDVMRKLSQWLHSCDSPGEDDVQVFAEYLVKVVEWRDLESVDCLMRYMACLVGNPKTSESWRHAYTSIVETVQGAVKRQYGSQLVVPCV